MIASELRLRRETPNRLVFGFNHRAGWFYVAVAAGGGYLAWSGGMWFLVPVGVVFGIAGLWAAAWRYDLEIDLGARRYLGRRGFWPRPVESEGPLEDLEMVVLSRASDRVEGHRVAAWQVNLQLAQWDGPINVYVSYNEAAARQRLEHYAGKLGVPAVDRTGPHQVVLPDATRREPSRSTSTTAGATPQVHFPPRASGVRWLASAKGLEVVMPAPGFGARDAVASVFAVFMGGMGALSLRAGLRADTPAAVAAGKHPAVGLVVGVVFLAMALWIVYFSLLRWSVAREFVRDEGDALRFGLRLGPWRLSTIRVLKRNVHRVTRRESTAPRGVSGLPLGTSATLTPPEEVAVLTDARVVVVGRTLERPGQEWLTETLRALLRRPAEAAE